MGTKEREESMNIITQMKRKIHEALKPTLLDVLDESAMHGRVTDSPSHLRVLIVSDEFCGLNSIQRHQKVHQAIGMDLLGQIHAFSQQTYTLEEWRQEGKAAHSPPCSHRNK